jgi:hypothetical protein
MRADPNIDTLFAAIGRATNAWETLEAHFSYLYSILVGRPMDIAAMKAYGREARIFAKRMEALDHASEQFFVSNPSQEREGIPRKGGCKQIVARGRLR